MKTNILTLLFALILGCSDHSSIDSGILDIDEFKVFDLNIRAGKVKLSKLIESIEVINLEETNEGLLGGVQQLFFDQDKFVVNDGRDVVFLYSSVGEFISKIDHRGNGPDEYSGIQSFWIKNDTLFLYDVKRRSLKWYGLYGKYLGETRVPIRVSHLYPNGREFVGDMDGGSLGNGLKFNLMFFDNKFAKVAESVPFIDSIPFPGLALNNFDFYGDEVAYKETFGDTVFLIQNRSSKALLKLNFGDDYFWNDREMVLNGNRALSEINKRDQVWYFDAEVGSLKVYISVSTSFSDSGLMQFLLDRSTGDLVKIDLRKSIEEKYLIRPLMWKENSLLVTLPPYDLEQLIEEVGQSNTEILGSYDMEDIKNSENPILLWIKFKAVLK